MLLQQVTALFKKCLKYNNVSCCCNEKSSKNKLSTFAPNNDVIQAKVFAKIMKAFHARLRTIRRKIKNN